MKSNKPRTFAGSGDLVRARPELDPQAAQLADTLRLLGENALGAVRRWADPRERELRRRRRTRRRVVRLGTASGLTTAGAVGLLVLSAPAWAVVVLGGGAVALGTGAVLTTRKYLRLRQAPLPQAAYQPRKLPPVRSGARPAMTRLAAAERALHQVGGQIGRSRRLPPDELDDLLATAASGAAALEALAADITAMEGTARTLGRDVPGQARPGTQHLADVLRAMLARLDTGVTEYEEVVGAAARVLATDENGMIRYEFDGIVADLRHAADRMDGWAQALTDLADRPGEFLASPAGAVGSQQPYPPIAEGATRPYPLPPQGQP